MYFVRHALYPLYDLQCVVLNILNNTVEYQTCSQLPLIYSRKGIWQGNLMGAKVPVKEGEKASHFSSFLPLRQRNLTKSFPLTSAYTETTEYESGAIQILWSTIQHLNTSTLGWKPGLKLTFYSHFLVSGYWHWGWITNLSTLFLIHLFLYSNETLLLK